ncbi:TPA: hypothetical protein LA742_001103 [Clostridium botulinum]|nr:hypothetical protein [Clostridium botulinum]
MAYTKTNWVDGFTPLNAEKMNNIENGIENCVTGTGFIQAGTVEYKSGNEGWQKGYTVGHLNKPFANVNFIVVATSCYSNGTTDMLPTIQNRDKQSFYVYIRNLDKAIPMVPVTINYIAISR